MTVGELIAALEQHNRSLEITCDGKGYTVDSVEVLDGSVCLNSAYVPPTDEELDAMIAEEFSFDDDDEEDEKVFYGVTYDED